MNEKCTPLFLCDSIETSFETVSASNIESIIRMQLGSGQEAKSCSSHSAQDLENGKVSLESLDFTSTTTAIAIDILDDDSFPKSFSLEELTQSFPRLTALLENIESKLNIGEVDFFVKHMNSVLVRKCDIIKELQKSKELLEKVVDLGCQIKVIRLFD